MAGATISVGRDLYRYRQPGITGKKHHINFAAEPNSCFRPFPRPTPDRTVTGSQEERLQRARCYLLGESAVVLELEPPITLDSQRRIWGLAARLQQHEEVREVIPGMNNLTVLLVNPQHEALDAIERLQRWWEE